MPNRGHRQVPHKRSASPGFSAPAVNSESLPSMSCPDGEAGQRPTLPTGGGSCGAATRGYTGVFCGRLPQVAALRRPPRSGAGLLPGALCVADYPADTLAPPCCRDAMSKICHTAGDRKGHYAGGSRRSSSARINAGQYFGTPYGTGRQIVRLLRNQITTLHLACPITGKDLIGEQQSQHVPGDRPGTVTVT